MAEDDVEEPVSLNILVDRLAESLESKPDKWLVLPQGWLSKPSFTQSETVVDGSPVKKSSTGNVFSDFKNRVKGSIISAYKRRWFVLNAEKQCLVYYKDDTPGLSESGFIDITMITDVQLSRYQDAPPFSIDLISKDRFYTVAADSEASMVLWAYAINACRPQKIEGFMSPLKQASDSALKTAKWTRYEYVYTYPGPLMLNVMGTSNKDKKTGKVINNWIVVTSFESTTDGKPGRSEATGLISVKDYIVAVNGQDLMKHTFNESMGIINNSTFPKTVTFLKDTSGDRTMSRAEGWAIVYYPSLNRKRRRYVDIRWDSINFRKPAPGGSANAHRDAYMSLGMIESIKPIIDKSQLSDQQFIVRLTCRENSKIDHVGDDDKSLGTSDVPYIDLCFAKESQMKNWRSVLVSPAIYASFESTSSIIVGDLEVLDAEKEMPTMTGEWANMAIKSELTGHFAPREFSIKNGQIQWMRVRSKQHACRLKKLELCTPTECLLTSARAVEVPHTQKNSVYSYLLILTTRKQSATIGMKDEATLLQWLALIRESVAEAPVDSDNCVYISDAVERSEEAVPTEEGGEEEDEDELDLVNTMRATEVNGVSNGLQGYLYKKSNRMLSTHSMFRRRWFVLHENTLFWYKSSIEVSAGLPPQGIILLSSAYEVRESVDPDAPENSIDIVTNAKTLTVAAVDETDYELWMDALSDTLEIREMAVQDGFNGGSNADQAARGLSKEERAAERIAAIRTAVVHGGPLSMKSAKTGLFKSGWKDRYFVIASGGLSYYHEQSDMFDEHKDCKGEIALINVLVVETSSDPKYKAGTVFDMHARVLEGGDADGMRVFTFNARTVENAEKWMRELCRATEILELKHVGSEGFASSVCEKMVKERNSRRTLKHTASAGIMIQSNRYSEQDDEVCSTADSNEDIQNRGERSESIDQGQSSGNKSRRPGVKIGMGRGVFFRPGARSSGKDSITSTTINEENKEEHGTSYGDLYGDGVI